MQWYYAQGGQTQGPVEYQVLIDMARSGALKPSDMVCNPSTGQDWVPGSSIQGLFEPQQGYAPPPSPPQVSASAGVHEALSRTPNADLMRFARLSLSGKWGLAIGIAVVYSLLTSVVSGTGVGLLVVPSLAVGLAIAFLNIARRREAEVGQLFQGFNAFGTALGAYFLMMLFIWLWSLLLIIPGIIAAFAYSLTFFIIADEPGVGASEALSKSKLMMRGNKWKLFCLQLRFFGWVLLCILTAGIGFLWLIPYMQTAQAHFYEDIRGAAA